MAGTPPVARRPSLPSGHRRSPRRRTRIFRHTISKTSCGGPMYHYFVSSIVRSFATLAARVEKSVDRCFFGELLEKSNGRRISYTTRKYYDHSNKPGRVCSRAKHVAVASCFCCCSCSCVRRYRVVVRFGLSWESMLCCRRIRSPLRARRRPGSRSSSKPSLGARHGRRRFRWPSSGRLPVRHAGGGVIPRSGYDLVSPAALCSAHSS